VPIAESIGGLAEVKEEGKIRHIGRSNFSRRPAQGGGAGDPGGSAWHEVIDQGELHDWRAAQLIRLGFPRPVDFTRLLAVGEITLGAALLLPIVPAAVAGAGLAAFSGGGHG
jgi:hypothetical protein